MNNYNYDGLDFRILHKDCEDLTKNYLEKNKDLLNTAHIEYLISDLIFDSLNTMQFTPRQYENFKEKFKEKIER
jgi:phosphoglucomutase